MPREIDRLKNGARDLAVLNGHNMGKFKSGKYNKSIYHAGCKNPHCLASIVINGGDISGNAKLHTCPYSW